VVAWFQPQVDLRTGRPVGAEALARWEHPARGMLPPGEFIALAERTNLIRPLTARIVECALAAAREWHDRAIDLRVAVNVSPRVLSDPDFPSCVEAALRRHGVAAGRLQLEVTESSLLTDPERSDRVVERLAALGVSLAIDDFGTGYSSLAQLSGLRVDTLKVDRSFVAALDGGGGPIVRAMVDLAEGLDLDVIAEGIEEQPTCAQLARMGCGIGQGYLFSRPLPADAFLAWVSEQRSFGVRAA